MSESTEQPVGASPVDARAPIDTLERVVAAGKAKASMSAGRTFFLAVLAGIYIGLGGMLMLIVKADQSLPFAASSLLSGAAFSLGLFAVLVAGAELFTGNNLMVLGLVRYRYGIVPLLRNWGIVYAGNLVGSLVVVTVLAMAGFAGLGGGAVGEAISAVGAAKASLTFPVAFARGIMCNFLVCLGVWMGFAGRTAADKFLAALMPVTAFVACGFEHCVANMMFLPLAMTQPGGPSPIALATNLVPVTLGNILGGAVLFAGLYALAFRKPRG